MNKRYQVFISSTFTDLRAERDSITRAVMELDCIPAGMEAFPAVDEGVLDFIKKVIDDSDYYVIVLAGRYGGTDKEGVSFTEREYDYAVDIGLPVLAFVHSNYSSFAGDKTDLHSEAQLRKFLLFRDKVMSGRMARMWDDPNQLPSIVVTALSRQMKVSPRTGWVRGNGPEPAELLLEINELRKQNALLIDQLGSQTRPLDNLASLDHPITLNGTRRIHSQHGSYSENWTLKTTFLEIFGLIAPELVSCPSDAAVSDLIASLTLKKHNKPSGTVDLDKLDHQTIKIQLEAHSLVNVKRSKTTKGDYGVFWFLTDQGKQLMMELRAVRAG